MQFFITANKTKKQIIENFIATKFSTQNGPNPTIKEGIKENLKITIPFGGAQETLDITMAIAAYLDEQNINYAPPTQLNDALKEVLRTTKQAETAKKRLQNLKQENNLNTGSESILRAMKETMKQELNRAKKNNFTANKELKQATARGVTIIRQLRYQELVRLYTTQKSGKTLDNNSQQQLKILEKIMPWYTRLKALLEARPPATVNNKVSSPPAPQQGISDRHSDRNSKSKLLPHKK